MQRRELCLGLNEQFGIPMKDQIHAIRDAGFDQVFLPYADHDTFRGWIKEAKSAGVKLQSVHAPFGGCRAIWEADEDAANAAMNEIVDCMDISCEDIPIAVSHVFIGFDIPPIPMEQGLERYFTLIRAAERRGMKLAFENTEGEEYLAAVLNSFGDLPHAGFCLDTGHELCYNGGKDLLARWGKLLIATHINDNLGVKDNGGRITWHDDLHLLPFDGVRDWEETARRLVREHYTGPLTFELNTKSKPDRHENDVYAAMPPAQYLAEAYKRACRLRALVEREENTIK